MTDARTSLASCGCVPVLCFDLCVFIVTCRAVIRLRLRELRRSKRLTPATRGAARPGPSVFDLWVSGGPSRLGVAGGRAF